jgi:hypothetical protein
MKNQAYMANLPMARLDDYNLFKSKAKRNAHGHFDMSEPAAKQRSRKSPTSAQIVGSVDDTDDTESEELKLEPESDEEAHSEKENQRQHKLPEKRKPEDENVSEAKKNGKKSKK